MGKSKARSKVEKRLRASKRLALEPYTIKNIEKLHENIVLSTSGINYRDSIKPNAFRFPNNPESEIPQHPIHEIIDLRSQKNPYSGFESAGNFRKKAKLTKQITARFADEIEEDEDIKPEKDDKFDIEENILLNKILNMNIDKKARSNKISKDNKMKIENDTKNNKKNKFNKKSKNSRILKFK